MKTCIKLPDEWKPTIDKFLSHDLKMSPEEFVRYEFLIAFEGVLTDSEFWPKGLTKEQAQAMKEIVRKEIDGMETKAEMEYQKRLIQHK